MYMPVVIFFERLDLEQNASFMNGHSVSSGFWTLTYSKVLFRCWTYGWKDILSLMKKGSANIS